ncbi:MAG: uracil-DNA glycosylase family protein, partial [Methyloligellaceae bacterium]
MPETAAESRRHRYLQAMQVDVWLRRDRAPGLADRPAAPSAKGDATPPAKVATMALAELEATVAGCRLCDLHSGRTQTVFGTGDAGARCMIIGEAPGAEEDARGEPFVG